MVRSSIWTWQSAQIIAGGLCPFSSMTEPARVVAQQRTVYSSSNERIECVFVRSISSLAIANSFLSPGSLYCA
jgi:hypothetical protein